MLKYLLKSAWETYKADGLRILIEQTLRYIGLYGSPAKIARYWISRFKGDNEPIVEVQGSLMRLNLKDKGIHSDLFINRIREPEATKYLQSILKPDWVVVDIGANIGYYAMIEARQAKRVYAIEPSKDNYRHLSQNIKLNKYKNITTYQLAIGDYNGDIGFHLAKACNWNQIANREHSADDYVKMVTLDSFLSGAKVDFVRMDVEGYELSILKGMDRVLTKSRPGIFIEVHRDMLKQYGSSQLELMQLLSNYDYSIAKSYISARESVNGKLRDILLDKKQTYLITKRGIASHIFFKGK